MNPKDRIFITGGTGFFGRSLLRYLIDANCDQIDRFKLTLLTRSRQTFLSLYPEFKDIKWINFHEGNILNPKSFPKSQSFTHILHAAADSTFGSRLSPLDRYNQIVNGTRNLLDYAAQNQIPRFLLTSSGAVYGPQPNSMVSIPEDYKGMPDPLNSNNAYGVAKRAAEHLCAIYSDQYNLETVIARCFAFVGPDLPLNVHFAIGNFIRDALWRDEITVSGDGTAVRSYMDQRDLASWLLAILEHGKSGHAYNVGSDESISISELAYLVGDLISPGKFVRILRKSIKDNGRNRYVPNIEKAKQSLDLTLRYTLDQSIQSTAESVLLRNLHKCSLL